MIKVGKVVGTSHSLCIATDSNNCHILPLGQTGTGKTTALRAISRSIASDGGRVLMLSFNGTQDTMQVAGYVQRISVRKTGFPFPILTPLQRSDGEKEEAVDVVEALIGVFSTVSRLDVRQKMELRRAALKIMHCSKPVSAFQRLGHELQREPKNKEALSVFDRFYPIFARARGTEESVYETVICPGQVTILDFGEFDRTTQIFFVELTLAFLWRMAAFRGPGGNEPLYLVLDEFQDLSLKKNSILAQLLREGRKYGISLLLATQTLEAFSKEQKALLQQAATQLYFRPAACDIKGILDMIGSDNRQELTKLLQSLSRGECLADGRFELEGQIIERPIKVSFWDQGGDYHG